MTVLLLHAIQQKAGGHWQQWLHDELVKQGQTVIMPTLPHSMHPDRTEWLNTVKDEVKHVDLHNLIIVGHSLGVVTALDFLEQIHGKIHTVISVAGFAEDYGAELNSYFLKEKVIDLEKVKKHAKNIVVIFGDNDPHVAGWALQKLATDLGVTPIIIKNSGHLNTESGYTEFPQLLKITNALS